MPPKIPPMCYEHDQAMLVHIEHKPGSKEKPVPVYACIFPNCTRMFVEEWGGYGEMGADGKFVVRPAWGNPDATAP